MTSVQATAPSAPWRWTDNSNSTMNPNVYGRSSPTGFLAPDAQVAQLVEQRTENPRVGSSNLSLGTTFSLIFNMVKGIPAFPHSLFFLLSNQLATIRRIFWPIRRTLSNLKNGFIPSTTDIDWEFKPYQKEGPIVFRSAPDDSELVSNNKDKENLRVELVSIDFAH